MKFSFPCGSNQFAAIFCNPIFTPWNCSMNFGGIGGRMSRTF